MDYAIGLKTNFLILLSNYLHPYKNSINFNYGTLSSLNSAKEFGYDVTTRLYLVGNEKSNFKAFLSFYFSFSIKQLTGCKGRSLPKAPSESPLHQVAATLLSDVQICQ